MSSTPSGTGAQNPKGLVGLRGFDFREVLMSSTATATPGAGSPWIHSRRFDLFFLTLSGALVFFPVPVLRVASAPRRLGGHREPGRRPVRHRPGGRPPHVLDVPADDTRAEVPRPIRMADLPAARRDPDPRDPRRAAQLPAAADRVLPVGLASRDPPGPVHLRDLPDAGGRPGPGDRPLARRRGDPRRAVPDGHVQVRREPVRPRRQPPALSRVSEASLGGRRLHRRLCRVLPLLRRASLRRDPAGRDRPGRACSS